MREATGKPIAMRPSTTDMPDGVEALGKAYRRRRLSPVAVVGEALDRAEASQDWINAFTTICRESALAEAKALEAAFERGEDPGPLAGVPLTVKDVIATRGVRTTFGSPAFADHMAAADSAAVERLRRAGAVVIGKTATPEFACRQTTTSALSGVTRNPWNCELTPGGSSGGSSASLAAGIGSLSLVTDGGGSARLPAACTGIAGFKPTFGLIPLEGAPDAFAGLGHIGLMARSVADIETALAVVAGPHGDDAASLSRHLARAGLVQPAGRPLQGLRVGWRERLHEERVGNAILPPIMKALCVIEELGASVERLTGEIEPPLPVWRTLQHAIWLERHGRRALTLPPLDPVIAAGIAHADSLSAGDLQAALHGRTRLFRQVQGWFENFDVLVTPTLARTPLPASHPGSGEIEIDGHVAGDIRAAWAPMLGLFTMTGHPAISINAGWTDDGLPVGMQLVGRWYEDRPLLQTARRLQEHLPAVPVALLSHPAENRSQP